MASNPDPDKVIKRIQELSRATPSLSERMAAHLNEMCGGEIEFFAVILAENSKDQMLVTTAGRLDDERVSLAIDCLVQALTMHATGKATPENQLYTRVRVVDDDDSTKH